MIEAIGRLKVHGFSDGLSGFLQKKHEFEPSSMQILRVKKHNIILMDDKYFYSKNFLDSEKFFHHNWTTVQ